MLFFLPLCASFTLMSGIKLPMSHDIPRSLPHPLWQVLGILGGLACVCASLYVVARSLLWVNAYTFHACSRGTQKVQYATYNIFLKQTVLLCISGCKPWSLEEPNDEAKMTIAGEVETERRGLICWTRVWNSLVTRPVESADDWRKWDWITVTLKKASPKQRLRLEQCQ